MKALWDSIVRTFTPIIVGSVVGWFVTTGITLDPEFEVALTLVVGAVFSGAYYLAVRLLETYVTPKFGWLLGLAKAPEYTPADSSATETAYRDIRDQVLVDASELDTAELHADIQAARERLGKGPV